MDYRTDEGVNLVDRWYKGQDEMVRANFDFALQEILGTNDLSDSTIFKPMVRRHRGLWEVVLEVRNAGRKRQIRPVGFWDYGERDFILVEGCEKAGRFTVPHGVFDNAATLMCQYFHEGRGTIHEHSI
jgi:hypothetical protein